MSGIFMERDNGIQRYHSVRYFQTNVYAMHLSNGDECGMIALSVIRCIIALRSSFKLLFLYKLLYILLLSSRTTPDNLRSRRVSVIFYGRPLTYVRGLFRWGLIAPKPPLIFETSENLFQTGFLLLPQNPFKGGYI